MLAPVAGSHSLTTLSAPPVAMWLPDLHRHTLPTKLLTIPGGKGGVNTTKNLQAYTEAVTEADLDYI